MKKIYVAIPYSGMEESSYQQANKVTAEILKMGYNPFSPITHSHPLTQYNVPGDWEFWSKVDMDWINVCDELWFIIPEEGRKRVTDSIGVQAEIKYDEEIGIPVKGYTFFDEKLKRI